VGDLGDKTPRQCPARARRCHKNQRAGNGVEGSDAGSAAQVQARRVAKDGGLAGGAIGRKNSAQLFTVSCAF